MPTLLTSRDGAVLTLTLNRPEAYNALTRELHVELHAALTGEAAEPAVRIVGTFPPDSHPPIVYPMALTAASTNPDAPALAAFLRGPVARARFEAQGFTVLDHPG